MTDYYRPPCACFGRAALRLVTLPDGEGPPFYACLDCEGRIGGGQTIEGHLLTRVGSTGMTRVGADVIAGESLYDCERCEARGATLAGLQRTACGTYVQHLDDETRSVVEASLDHSARRTRTRVHYQPAPDCRCSARAAVRAVEREGATFYLCLDCNERVGGTETPPGHLVQPSRLAARPGIELWDCVACEVEGAPFAHLAQTPCGDYIARLEEAVRTNCDALRDAAEAGAYEALRAGVRTLAADIERLASAQAAIAERHAR